MNNISKQITVGKDILELLTSGMYLDPLTIYREYIQNSADSIEKAVSKGLLKSTEGEGEIKININYIDRSIIIEDNGTGLSSNEFSKILLSFGNSPKRGTDARGFRGIGRLAGLAYCQELIFTSKSAGEKKINTLKWDCRQLKKLLVDHTIKSDLKKIVDDSTTHETQETNDTDTHFFKVELKKILRLKNDVLLNNMMIEKYLSQVAPVPFSDSFKFKNQINELLREKIQVSYHNILLNGETAITRTFRNSYDFNAKTTDYINSVEKLEIVDNDNELLAYGFLLNHGYLGAINKSTALPGLRARVGNIQIGENTIFLDQYSESRFNAWTIGELHILTPKLVPNGRRDDFEKNNFYYNFVNHISLITKHISEICRQRSQVRNQEKVVEINNVRSKKRESAANKIIDVASKFIKNKEEINKVRNTIYDEISKL